jgi:hypothetical protein
MLTSRHSYNYIMLSAKSAAAGLLASLIWFSPGAGQPPPQPPMRVMTDTPEYCQHLQRVVDRLQAATQKQSPDIAMLSNEGKLMCAQGLVKGGIARLRSALNLLHTGG